MEDPFEDTEWNDILRRKGVLPKLQKEKEEDREEVDQTEKMPNLDELEDDEFEDLMDKDDDEFLEQYRRQRMATLEALKAKNKFGHVRQITGQDYVTEVTKASEDGTWVILHLYRDGVQLCNVINHHFNQLAAQFPMTKFLKGVSTTVIPNYPDKNLPTIFVYHEGKMKAQIIGPQTFSNNVSKDQLEWCFLEMGAVPSSLEKNPVDETRDAIKSSIRSSDNSKNKFWGE